MASQVETANTRKSGAANHGGITLTNLSAGDLTEAVVINFVVLQAVAA